MKELLLNELRTKDLARLCDSLSIETTREVRTSREKMKELLIKERSYKQIREGINGLN